MSLKRVWKMMKILKCFHPSTFHRTLAQSCDEVGKMQIGMNEWEKVERKSNKKHNERSAKSI